MPDEDYANGQVLVGLRGPAPDTIPVVDAAGRATELQLERTILEGQVGVYWLPATLSVPDAIEQLIATGQNQWVEPNFLVEALESTFSPNDPYYDLQWHLTAVDAEGAWEAVAGSSETIDCPVKETSDEEATGGGEVTTTTGVIVAVLDTGVSEHATDGITNLLAGQSCVDTCVSTASSADEHGHGSHLAAVIGQRTNNCEGTAGLAYNAYILPVRVLSTAASDKAKGEVDDVADGMTWAVAEGANILNLSLGTDKFSNALALAIKNTHTQGVLMVAATGNANSNDLWWPAAHPAVLAVGSTNHAGSVSSTSNRGCGVDLVAPGGESTGEMVLQTAPYELYMDYMWGTSVSAAMVSASAALVWSAHPEASAEKVREALLATAEDLGSSGYDTTYGYGLVQPAAAIAALDAGSASTDDTTCTVQASTGSVSCSSSTSPITRVSTSSGLTLRLNMNGYKDLQIEGELASASGWALNLADSSTNDGYCGDSGTTMYDAEAWILSSGFYVCDSDMGGSDYEVNKPSAVTTSSDRISLEVCDGELSFLSETTAATLDSSTAFQIGGDEKDSRGVTNDQYLYLGIKRVVRTTSRSGSGADELTLRFVR